VYENLEKFTKQERWALQGIIVSKHGRRFVGQGLLANYCQGTERLEIGRRTGVNSSWLFSLNYPPDGQLGLPGCGYERGFCKATGSKNDPFFDFGFSFGHSNSPPPGE